MSHVYSRRELATIGLAGLAAPLAGLFAHAAADVHLGVNTSSFGRLPRASGSDLVDALIQALVACDVHDCELSAGQVEPRFGGEHAGHHTMSSMSPQMMRRELRKWRLRTPTSYFAAIGARFRQAGVAIHTYNYSPDRSFTDEEINQGFVSARALGAELVTAVTTADVARRLAPFADRHRMIVAIGEDSRPAGANAAARAVESALSLSPYFKVNLDIGHCITANLDTIDYLRAHHATIRTLRLKDWRRNGESVPWGTGDAPLREVLQLLKREAWPIRAYVEYDYAGHASPVDEVKRCLAYATRSLV